MKRKTRRKSKTRKSMRYDSITKILIVVMVAILLYNNYNLMTLSKTSDVKIGESEEAARPANLEITTIISEDCSDCKDLSFLVDGIKQMNVRIIAEKTLDYNSLEARNLIEKYEIKKVPSILISGEIYKETELKDILLQIGTINDDGTAKITANQPIYLDLISEEIIGRTSLISIVDDSCGNCYDVGVHKTVLRGLGFDSFVSEETYDVSSKNAKDLISRYNISAVPTILLSPGAREYPLEEIWLEVGTIESDGWHIFRNIDFMNFSGGYIDLTTNENIF